MKKTKTCYQITDRHRRSGLFATLNDLRSHARVQPYDEDATVVEYELREINHWAACLDRSIPRGHRGSKRT
jgi:hypothetical protein